MKITEFTISNDNSELELTITDAASITSLKLWKSLDYKDISKAIDLSSKLTSSATENITISLSDIQESYFDGVYFIEAEDPNELSLQYTYTLLKYKECILDKLIYLDVEDCFSKKNIELVNAHSFLKGLEYALEGRFINEILQFLKVLDKYCSSDCKSCGKDIIDSNESQNVSTPISGDIIVNVDGGNR